MSFGDFLFDVDSGDLTRNDVRIKVNKQVTDMLTLLISNPGQLVTREQIREALWPGQEFLSHEKIITNVVSRLRLTLNDDPAQPRFIESIPKRGYRWLEKLEPADVPTGDVAAPAEPEQILLAGSPAEPVAVPAIPALEEPQAFSQAIETKRQPIFWLLLWTALILILGLSCALFLKNRKKSVQPIAAREVSLGIAPFETNTPEAKDLAESFELDLTDSLAQLPQINVRAAHSLKWLSQDSATFAENASHLGLDVLLLGKLRLDGKKCVLELELVRGKDLSHLSSFNYSAPSDDLRHLRDQIQMEIFSKLNPANVGTAQAEATLAPGSTNNRQAYSAYLHAGLELAEQTPESLQAALHGYQEAIAADPQFGHAYAHLARTYVYLTENGLAPRGPSMDEAMKEADKALSLDPNDADAHDIRGMVYMLRDWDLHSGELELQQSILLSPNEALHHQWLSLVYFDEGRFEDALKEIDIAHQEDPYWISAYVTDVHISSMARNNAHAQTAIRRLLQLEPKSPHALDAIGNGQWYLHNYADAIASWKAMAVEDADPHRMALEDRGAAAFRAGGPQAYARVRLEAIAAGNNGTEHSNDFQAGEWYAMAGETEMALAALRRGVASHDLWMLELGVSPAYDGLRQNREFQQILDQTHAMMGQHS